MLNLRGTEKSIQPGVLIIDGHVQGLSLARALGERGIPVIIGDRVNCIARYSKYVKDFIKTPDFLSPDFIPFLIDLSVKKGLQDWAIFPTDDHVVYQLSKHKNILLNYFKIISPDFDILLNIYNKRNLYSIANQVEVLFPRTYYPVDLNLDHFGLNFPVLIKGNEGQTFYKITGKKAFKCHDLIELRQRLNSLILDNPIENVFIQEMLPLSLSNRTVSYTCFAINGEIKTRWVGRKMRDHPINFGTSTMSESISLEILDEPVRKLIRKLKFTGTCEIEFLKDTRDDQFKLIEINPRTWLWVSLAKTCGVDYATLMYNYMYGIENNYPADYIKNVKWVNFLTDIPFSIAGIISGYYNIKEVLSSYSYIRDTSVFRRDDLLPFFHMVLQLPLLPFRR